MNKYEKLKHDLRTFLIEYFSTKGIDINPQIYEDKICDDIYYREETIEIDIYIGEDCVEICLNAYPVEETDISEHIGMGTSIPIIEDKKALSVNVTRAFMRMYSRLEKIIDFMKEDQCT